MESKIFNIKYGRMLCGVLVLVDIFLGGLATFFPYLYSSMLHPELVDPPIDFIVRTGILWLGFLFFQLLAALSKNPEKWFFAIAILRLMDVPADIIYATLAIGATITTKLMILIAPVFNIIFGVYLYILSEKIKKGVILKRE